MERIYTRGSNEQINRENRTMNTLAERARKDWSEYAGEPITTEVIGGAVYAFGSELACLRIEHKMRVGRAEYSKNLQTWTYCMERK